MYTLYNFLNGIFVLSITIAAIFFIKDISYAIDLVKAILRTRENLDRWKMGLINLDDVHSLTPREFEYWCGEFISNLGYSNIKQTPMGPDGGKDIICRYNNLDTYVECKRYLYDSYAKHKVDEHVCKKLVGAMVHDGISHGVIITSGIIVDGCYKYIKSLPKGIDIKFIDGKALVELYWKLHSKQKRSSA
ncbi:restriction endonuclease [Clostridium thermarum]|uniref:restriction endonuclease n=1 Tax=Clostridium thermarum TaxID=1716543 RepID=UPI001120E4C3|nr:restriction endonuclease [Clostridium thermarum]